jgi:hypothetical protein
MRCSKALILALSVAAVVLNPRSGAAQYNTAELSGTVMDALGGALAGATVVATHIGSGLMVARTTDATGRFFLPVLPVGEYIVSISLSGFRSMTGRLTLQVGQKIELPIMLSVGGLTDALTVAGVTPLLQTSNAEVSDIVANQQVVSLPLNGRQFLQLSLVTDGAVIPPGGTRGAAVEQAGVLPAIEGQRSGHNIYLLDGVKVTDEYFNNLAISPSVDSIQEFKIDKTMYAAEFGGKSSALINVVTKSGNNAYRGSGFEFYRNNALDAHNYFDDQADPVPPLHQHQFGTSVGGPVQLGPWYDGHDTTFFYVNYEGQRLRRSLTQTYSVPTAATRSGNFAGAAPIIDPLTGAAFSGNQIPPNRLDPIALNLLAKVPPPTSGGTVQNLLAIGNETTPMHQVTVRVDHRAGGHDTLFGRFSTYTITDNQPFGTSSLNETLVPGFGRIVSTTSRNLALSETHTFSDRVLNELRFGWLSVGGGQTSPNQGSNFAAATGLQGATTNRADLGYPQVSFGGLYSTFGDPAAFVSRQDRSVELYDNVLVARGSHLFKAGAYVFHLDFNPVLPNTARGAFTFTGQFTGNALADFLLGYPSSGQVGIGRGAEQGRTTWFHVYGQDDWHVRSNLTLDYGLRYEVNGQMTDANNQLSAVDVPDGRFVIASSDGGQISPFAQALLAQIPLPYVTSQQAGWTPALLRPSYLRFAPRLGASWTPVALTAVRGGFGVFLNQWAYSVQQALAENLPFFELKSVNVPSDATMPPYQTATMLLASGNGTIGGTTMDHDSQTEYAKNVTLGFQRALTTSTMVDISYLGSWVTAADSSTVLNVPPPGPGPIAPRRPIPALSNISDIRWNGYSIYHGVTVKVVRHLARGLAYSASYTLSKAIDDASDPGATVAETNLPQNVYDLSAERAPSSFDHRHRFVANTVYVLPDPAGTSPLAALGRQWRINAIVTLQSGSPFTVNLGTDRANIGSGPAQRPNVSCDPNMFVNPSPTEWFNTSCFSLPAAYSFGNAGRNSVLGPGYADVDVGLERDISLAGGSRLRFRLETFNLLNRVNFGAPNRTFGTANFGRIFSAEPARQMQLSVKFLY